MQNVFLLTHWNDYQGFGFKTHLNQICQTKCPMYIYFHMRPLLMQSHCIKPILSLMQLNVLHSLRVAPPSGGMERLQSPLKNDEEPGTSEGCGLKIPWLHLFMNGFIRLDSRVDRKGNWTERETWCVTWQQTGTPCDGVAFGVTPPKLNIICWTMLVYDPPHHVSSHHNRDSILPGAADEVVTFGVIVGAHNAHPSRHQIIKVDLYVTETWDTRINLSNYVWRPSCRTAA